MGAQTGLISEVAAQGPESESSRGAARAAVSAVRPARGGVPRATFAARFRATDSLLREAEEAINADSSGRLKVEIGQLVIDGFRHSCVSPGGTVFTPTGLEVVVPVVAILAFDLDVQQLEVRRTFRTHIDKWQLSSDDHGRVLRLLSETLDDQVAAAVQNVSGRS